MSVTDQQSPNPDRFSTAKSTLFIDSFMTWAIRSGGVGIIIAVFGIFLFIGWQVLPLFSSAHIQHQQDTALPADVKSTDIHAVVSDEWGELPSLVLNNGTVVFLPKHENSKPSRFSILDDTQASTVLSVIKINHRTQMVTAGTNDGRVFVKQIAYSSSFDEENAREIKGTLKSVITGEIGQPGHPITHISYGDGGKKKLVAAIQLTDLKPRIYALPFTQKRSLIGAGKIVPGKPIELTDRIQGTPNKIIVDERADSIIITNTDGVLYYFFDEGDDFVLRQKFQPFADQPDASSKTISTLNYLLGDVSLVTTNTTGLNRVFSLYVKPDMDSRTFGLTKELPPLPGGASTYAPSIRNKAFLLTHEGMASLRYGTSASIRWENNFDFTILSSALSGKYHRLFLLGSDNILHSYTVDDPHPESGFNALFGKVWYEGADSAAYVWQSSGGSDDFEPKISMVPLLIGSLKGTIYALLFAIPIAVLGALYTAEFMNPRFKSIVKPIIEIMASLPSVVLGFLAALWLAPLIEDKVPSFLMVVAALPVTALTFGWIWSQTPNSVRSLIRPGYEFIYFFPILIVSAVVAWYLGPVVESILFSVDGHGDFRQWWRNSTGLPFEQRNSLVVGIMMGFAVIPIIFTIAEDALSNVPPALRSASLALGASRWQTAMRVVLPTASAGIFSALMIGFGRAIGETMIVVMATGNTPILGLNIFDGMRTLSANIAVELPEAPQHSTLYRTLFLGALLLFMLTFLINTAAELLRQHLREKYKTV